MTEETKVTTTKDVKKTVVKPTLKKAAPTVDPELMKKHQQMVNFLRNEIGTVEIELKKMKAILDQLVNFDPTDPKSLEIAAETQEAMNAQELNTYSEEGVEVIEGVFDGYFMIGADQKKYPVPMNYSSKTKMIPGDVLKLKIMPDGKFVYKLIRPAERKHLRAILSRTDENKFTANTDDGKIYFLNQAAVTFFKGTPGDELYIIVNEKDGGAFAAIEAIIKK
ncbi:MAG: hypothetical protein PHU61_01435 [Candidatus Absconditabacteria bacterium]|nr:hypothetical protein [Candidatus Absconditabacteria bacterium]MDD3868038.1 hypothetical protein [Candidatus Absconditabacteria bacterium]MDD4714285.1 hypothetical protein [Candidatus Absconditabacteria bacterium]